MRCGPAAVPTLRWCASRAIQSCAAVVTRDVRCVQHRVRCACLQHAAWFAARTSFCHGTGPFGVHATRGQETSCQPTPEYPTRCKWRRARRLVRVEVIDHARRRHLVCTALAVIRRCPRHTVLRESALSVPDDSVIRTLKSVIRTLQSVIRTLKSIISTGRQTQCRMESDAGL